MQIRPDLRIPEQTPVRPVAPLAPRVEALPVGDRVEVGPAPPAPAAPAASVPAAVEVEAPAAAPAPLPALPDVLLALDEPAPVSLATGARPPAGTEAADHQRLFEARLPQAERAAWTSTWSYARTYDQESVDMPFPFPGREGRLDLGDVLPTVQGLHALGAHATARGVLENWLDLGERFTALPGCTRLNELGRSAPPRLSSLVLAEAATHPDPEFLPRAYRVVADDHQNTWSDKYFHLTPTGLARYTDVDYSHEASLIESGGAKNEARFEGDPGAWNAVDLNAWLYRTEKDLETMARTLGDPKADEWAQKASDRKARLLDTLWDPASGSFRDWNYRENRFSDVPSLASYSVMAAGVLDPSVPREKRMLESLVAALPEGLPEWSPGVPADAADLLMVAEGLDRYGYDSAKMRGALQERLDATPPAADPRELGARAILRGAQEAPEPQGLAATMSPEGRARLLGLAGEGATVRPQDAGPLDRRLRQLHPSALQPQVARDLRERNLSQLVYGVRPTEAGWVRSGPGPLGPGRPVAREEEVQFGPVRLRIGVPDATLHAAADGAAVLRAGGRTLPLVLTNGGLLIGDRLYELPQGTLDLPRDLLGDFSRAGGNPTLEAFFDANRGWLDRGAAAPPPSAVGAMAARPEWKGLFDLVGRNWKDLTFEPSVVARGTNVQYFHPAAVPSVGIFKTQFNWDSYFMARGMNLQGQGRTVVGMADNLLYLLKTTGRVPNAARSVYLNKSQPPILPMLVREAAPIREALQGRQSTERWLSEALDLMGQDYQGFWCKTGPSERGIDQIEGHPVRLARYGGDNSKFAMDESGFDTTSRFEGRALDVVPVELNSFLWQGAREMELLARDLSDRAAERGDMDAAGRYGAKALMWQSEAQARKADLIRWCWDEEDGMFRDRVFQGEGQGLMKSQDSLAPTVAPLWVGMLDPQDPKERRMIERSLDKIGRFEKEHGLAAMASDYGHPEMQWNGPSGWAPLHVMAVEALTKHGRYSDAARITGKWLDTVAAVHANDGLILERYDMNTGGHPPVQKGRYEETQGAGPGFGWTNATIPWAMLEIVAGTRLEPGGLLRVVPHVPKALEGSPFSVEYRDPAGQGAWQVTQRYDGSSYSAQVAGSGAPRLELLTPPLPPGRVPRVEAPVEHRTQAVPTEGGMVRYRVLVEGLSGTSDVRVTV